MLPAVFYAVEKDLIEKEADPLFIGIHRMRHSLRLNPKAVLDEKLLIARDNFADAVLQGNTADQVILFHTAQTGVKKNLFHVLLHALRLRQNPSKHIRLKYVRSFVCFGYGENIGAAPSDEAVFCRFHTGAGFP